MDAHGRFESLAVGHVLGGLDASDDDEFRAHLRRCGACRRRVQELRTIGDELAAAERDERAQAAAARDDGTDGVEAGLAGAALRAVRPGTLALVVVLTLVVVGALAFWNLHLRTQLELVTDAAARDQASVAVLAEGVLLEADRQEGVRGPVAYDDERVAVALTGLPRLVPDERIVVWLTGGPQGDEAALLVVPDDDVLSLSLPVGEATGVRVTVEIVAGGVPSTPGARTLVQARFDDARR